MRGGAFVCDNALARGQRLELVSPHQHRKRSLCFSTQVFVLELCVPDSGAFLTRMICVCNRSTCWQPHGECQHGELLRCTHSGGHVWPFVSLKPTSFIFQCEKTIILGAFRTEFGLPDAGAGLQPQIRGARLVIPMYFQRDGLVISCIF